MRGRRLLRPLFFSLGLSLLGAAPAFAASAADKAAAEALFDQGRKLLSEGKVEDACKKFEGSQRVDPGIGTLLYLADCYERAGRTASAWATFREAASAADAAGQDDRAETGRKRAERLQATLAHLTVTVATELENMEGLTVHYKNQDSGREEALSKALFGSPVPVDPGKYQVTAAAPGYQSFEGAVTITEAANQELAIPALVVDEAVAEPVPVVAAKEEGAPAEGSNEGGSARHGQCRHSGSWRGHCLWHSGYRPKQSSQRRRLYRQRLPEFCWGWVNQRRAHVCNGLNRGHDCGRRAAGGWRHFVFLSPR